MVVSQCFVANRKHKILIPLCPVIITEYARIKFKCTLCVPPIDSIVKMSITFGAETFFLERQNLHCGAQISLK